MTTEDDFQAALDANPKSWQTRLVFADWLQERGDERAEGYRALGALRKRPHCVRSKRHRGTSVDGCWFFHNDDPDAVDKGRSLQALHGDVAKGWNGLPPDWMRAGEVLLADRTPHAANHQWMGHRKARREVEDFAALAFATLPAARRAELLAAGG